MLQGWGWGEIKWPPQKPWRKLSTDTSNGPPRLTAQKLPPSRDQSELQLLRTCVLLGPNFLTYKTRELGQRRPRLTSKV